MRVFKTLVVELLPVLVAFTVILTIPVHAQILDFTKQSEVLDLKIQQATLYENEGRYEQIPGVVNVYQSPEGWGYQTIAFYSDRVEYVGYGVQSKDYTFTIPITPASSTIPSGVDFGLEPGVSLVL